MRGLLEAGLLLATVPALWIGYANSATPPTPSEREIVRQIAPKFFGDSVLVEVPLADGTRADIVTPWHAIEVDWSEKWAEAPGQAIWYATMTNRKPGVVLLVKDADREKANICRCAAICGKLEINLWIWPIGQKSDIGLGDRENGI